MKLRFAAIILSSCCLAAAADSPPLADPEELTFENCFGRANVPAPEPCRPWCDRDWDGDCDQSDFGVLQRGAPTPAGYYAAVIIVPLTLLEQGSLEFQTDPTHFILKKWLQEHTP